MRKLNKFNKINKKRNFLIIGAFLLEGLILVGVSYAVYQKEDEVRFINAKVGEFETSSSDIELAMTLDGEDIDTPPVKGYYNVTIDCDHADGIWHKDKWSAEIGNIISNRVKCSVNFETTLADKVEVGDYISMTPTSTSYTLPSNLTGCLNDSNCTQNTLNPSELNLWRVIKKNEDGTIEVVSEYVSSNTVWFYGLTGYANFVKGLEAVASQYTNEKYVERTRHVGHSNQTEIITSVTKLTQGQAPWNASTSLIDQWSSCNASVYLCGNQESFGAGDVGYETDYNLINSLYKTMKATNVNKEDSAYWISSRYYQYYDKYDWYTYGRIVSKDGNLHGSFLYYYWELKLLNRKDEASVRPVLTLKSDDLIINGDGKSAETAYQFE